MLINKKQKYVLLSLLTLYNIILRLPVTPHELGWDSFEIHAFANVITTFGYAKWWLHPLSIFGFYPYSYASAVPFTLSGISQLTSIEMETTVWIFSFFIGVFSYLPFYLLAGLFKQDELFKILAAFIYSTSQSVLYFTTWTVSTRGLFIVLLPLMVYLLLQVIQTKKYILLYLLLGIFLLSTHHLIYFTSLFIISFPLAFIILHLNTNTSYTKVNNAIFYLLPLAFVASIIYPFFSRSFIESGSRYIWIISQFTEYARQVGPLLVYLFSGFYVLFSKREKNMAEYFLIIVFVLLAPFLYMGIYTKWFAFFMFFLVISLSLMNIFYIQKNPKFVQVIIIAVLVVPTIFSCYFQFIDPLNQRDYYSNYMEEPTYVGSLWIQDNIGSEYKILGGSYINARVLATSNTPTLIGGPTDIVYGFVDPSELIIEREGSLTSLSTYSRGNFYTLINASSPSWGLYAIRDSRIDEYNSWAQRLTIKYNVSYAVENTDVRSTFDTSLNNQNLNYDNGKMRIWQL